VSRSWLWHQPQRRAKSLLRPPGVTSIGPVGSRGAALFQWEIGNRTDAYGLMPQ